MLSLLLKSDTAREKITQVESFYTFLIIRVFNIDLHKVMIISTNEIIETGDARQVESMFRSNYAVLEDGVSHISIFVKCITIFVKELNLCKDT